MLSSPAQHWLNVAFNPEGFLLKFTTRIYRDIPYFFFFLHPGSQGGQSPPCAFGIKEILSPPEGEKGGKRSLTKGEGCLRGGESSPLLIAFKIEPLKFLKKKIWRPFPQKIKKIFWRPLRFPVYLYIFLYPVWSHRRRQHANVRNTTSPQELVSILKSSRLSQYTTKPQPSCLPEWYEEVSMKVGSARRYCTLYPLISVSEKVPTLYPLFISLGE